MEKIVLLREVVSDGDSQIAILETYLRGDGSTPMIQAMGGRDSNIIGYKDNGEPIIRQNEDELIKTAKIKLMAEAIKEQKKLCVENGVDPDVVNMIGLEKKVNNE